MVLYSNSAEVKWCGDGSRVVAEGLKERVPFGFEATNDV